MRRLFLVASLAAGLSLAAWAAGTAFTRNLAAAIGNGWTPHDG